MKTKAPLPYYGSDSAVAPELGALLDHCRHVTIPFCGGMSILPHLKATHVVANDLNCLAINFYEVASEPDYQGLLFDMCERTLSHPEHIERANECIGIEAPKIERAWAYWALCWIGRKGKGGTPGVGGAPSIRRTPTGGNNASRIASAAADLTEWAKHFRRCEWECRDFREVLGVVKDRPDCGVYVDAPWVGPGDQYLHKFIWGDHVDLRNSLGHLMETTVIIRYGDHPDIRELYHNWHITEASSRTQANKMADEIWITNRLKE